MSDTNEDFTNKNEIININDDDSVYIKKEINLLKEIAKNIETVLFKNSEENDDFVFNEHKKLKIGSKFEIGLITEYENNFFFGIFNSENNNKVNNIVKKHFFNFISNNKNFKINNKLALYESFQKMSLLLEENIFYKDDSYCFSNLLILNENDFSFLLLGENKIFII